MLSSQKPFRGTQLNRTHPLAKGLVGCWLFNEATGETIFDLSGHGNNGTLENGTAWGSDGLEFDGNNDYVDLGADITFADGDWSLLFNFNQPISAIIQNIVCSGGVVTNTSRTLNIAPRRLRFYDGSGYQTSDTDFESNIFNQGGYVLSGTDITFYLNGQPDGSAPVGYSGAANDLKLRYIGADHASTRRYFNGFINNIYIYNQAKSDDEIAWLYREPYAMFEPAFNPALLYSAAPPIGAIMNQFQKANIGADLYNGVIIS